MEVAPRYKLLTLLTWFTLLTWSALLYGLHIDFPTHLILDSGHPDTCQLENPTRFILFTCGRGGRGGRGGQEG